MKIKGNRWAVFICAFVSVAAAALSNVWSVLLNPLAETYGCSTATVQLAYSVYALTQAVFGIISAAMLKKVPFKAIIIYGSACMAAGFAGLGFSSTTAGMFFSYGILYGMGSGCAFSLSVSNTLKWFPTNKGRISGMLLAASAIMGMIIAPLANSLIEAFGVKTCCLAIAGGSAVVFSLTAWMAQDAPEVSSANSAASSGGTVITTRDYTWQEMIRSPMFFVALSMFICANTGYVMMVTSSSSIAQGYTGMTAAAAATAVSATFAFNLFGRLFFGWLSDKIGRVNVLTLICVTAFLMLAVLSRTVSQTVFVVGMFVIGICGGALLANMPTICTDCFGVKHSSVNYSILIFGYAVSSYVAPMLTASFGTNYSAVLLCAGIICFAGAVLVRVLGYMMKKAARQQINYM